MSYQNLRNYARQTVSDIDRNLRDFCDTLQVRYENGDIEIGPTIINRKKGYEIRLQKEVGIDYEKGIYSLSKGVPEIKLNTLTREVCAIWNGYAEVKRMPITMHEWIQKTCDEIFENSRTYSYETASIHELRPISNPLHETQADIIQMIKRKQHEAQKLIEEVNLLYSKLNAAEQDDAKKQYL